MRTGAYHGKFFVQAGRTVSMLAADGRDFEAVIELVKAGAKLTIQDEVRFPAVFISF